MMQTKTCLFSLAGLLFLIGTNCVVAQENINKKAQKASLKFLQAAESAKTEGNFVQSEADYRRALSKSTANADASYNLSHLYTSKKLEHQAMSRLIETAQTAKTKPLKHKAYHNLGNAFMAQKDYKQAVQAYEDALRNDPTDDQTRYNLALAKEKEKQQQQKNKNKKNKDQKKDQDQKNKQKNKDNKNQKDNKKQQQKKQQQDQNKKDQNKDQQKNKPQQNKDQQRNPQNKNQQKQQQPQQPQKGELSKQQAENILKAIQNQEKKVQQKLNKREAKRAPSNPNEKDW